MSSDLYHTPTPHAIRPHSPRAHSHLCAATGRRPALFDNLFQSFVLAPFFVFLEVLFKLGYRPALHRAINNETGKRILAFRKAQQGQGQDQSQAQ